jgi:hypothetical protein
MNRDRRKQLRFLILFLCLFALLGWPYARLGRGYRLLVCRAVNALIMNSTQTTSVARLLPDERPGFEWHAVIAVWNQTAKALEAKFPIDLHQPFYLPTAAFVALTLAGQRAWGGKRVLLKLLLGIILFQLRPLPIFLVRERAVVGVFQYDGLFDVLLVILNRSIIAPLGMAFALPLFVWFGLFRRSFVQFVQAKDATADSPEQV